MFYNGSHLTFTWLPEGSQVGVEQCDILALALAHSVVCFAAARRLAQWSSTADIEQAGASTRTSWCAIIFTWVRPTLFFQIFSKVRGLTQGRFMATNKLQAVLRLLSRIMQPLAAGYDCFHWVVLAVWRACLIGALPKVVIFHAVHLCLTFPPS